MSWGSLLSKRVSTFATPLQISKTESEITFRAQGHWRCQSHCLLGIHQSRQNQMVGGLDIYPSTISPRHCWRDLVPESVGRGL